MRFDIMRHDKVIGHVNFDDMDTDLLKMFISRGYRIELVTL